MLADSAAPALRGGAQVDDSAPALRGGAQGSPIDLDGSFFIQLAIFFLAFLILRALVFRPVMDLFDARAKAIVGSREQAAHMEREAERERSQLESELRRVRQQ